MNKKSTNDDAGTRLFEDFRELSHKILAFSNKAVPLNEFFEELSKIIINFSCCDTIEIWLKDASNFYRSLARLQPKDFFEFYSISKNEIGSSGNYVNFGKDNSLVDLCIDFINGNIDQSLPYFTKTGSFLVDNTDKLQILKKEDNNNIIKNILAQVSKSYKSAAIIPFEADDEDKGLLVLKSSQRKYFTSEEIEFYETAAKSLGITWTNRKAHWALGERIKELTCLYSISKVLAEPKIPVEKILQLVVDLLPSAWQYSDFAGSRIYFDNGVYLSQNFNDGLYRQSSDIIINSEKRGYVEVVYSKKVPEQYEGPFLKEERNLIDAVAKELALIIERKKNENERIDLQEQLKHADRLATIGQLAAGVAHELNEPLGNMLGFAQLAKKHTDIPVEVVNDLEKIEKASLHARDTVKKLLLFARQMPFQMKPANLNEIVEGSMFFYEPRCRKEGIILKLSLSKNLPAIEGDPSQLSQALINIVINAIHAMNKGGKLLVKTSFDSKYVYLAVEDNGTGMSEEVKRKMFLPFFTTKDINEGTGLGLPVVHGIVMSHNGKINVSTRIGKGTKFEIGFPYKKPKEVVQENDKIQ
ncbi:ATP-binding protein [candidate division KSB1 bacterium]